MKSVTVDGIDVHIRQTLPLGIELHVLSRGWFLSEHCREIHKTDGDWIVLTLIVMLTFTSEITFKPESFLYLYIHRWILPGIQTCVVAEHGGKTRAQKSPLRAQSGAAQRAATPCGHAEAQRHPVVRWSSGIPLFDDEGTHVVTGLLIVLGVCAVTVRELWKDGGGG